jgi:hypothetical protein
MKLYFFWLLVLGLLPSCGRFHETAGPEAANAEFRAGVLRGDTTGIESEIRALQAELDALLSQALDDFPKAQLEVIKNKLKGLRDLLAAKGGALSEIEKEAAQALILQLRKGLKAVRDQKTKPVIVEPPAPPKKMCHCFYSCTTTIYIESLAVSNTATNTFYPTLDADPNGGCASAEQFIRTLCTVTGRYITGTARVTAATLNTLQCNAK